MGREATGGLQRYAEFGIRAIYRHLGLVHEKLVSSASSLRALDENAATRPAAGMFASLQNPGYTDQIRGVR